MYRAKKPSVAGRPRQQHIVPGNGRDQTTRPIKSKFPAGQLPLERRCQRLHDLRLAATVADPLSRWLCNVGGVLFHTGTDDVGGQHRHHVRRLVALETGLLNKNRKPVSQPPV